MRIQKIQTLAVAVQLISLLAAQDSTLWAQAWEPGVPMLSLRTSPGVTVGSDGLIYAIGGTADMYGSLYATNTAERFNESTQEWEWIAPMAEKRLAPGAVTDSFGRIWIIGGHDVRWEPYDTIEIYDPVSESWSIHPSRLNTGRTGHGIAITKDDVIYVFGGVFSPPEVYLSSVEKYDPSVGEWEFVCPMNEARWGVGCAVDEQGRIYAIGGGREGIGALKTVERYDPLRDQWEYVADLPEIRGSMATFVCCGEIWAVGGGKNVPYYTDTSYIYSPATNTWREGPRMYEAIGHARAAVGPSGTAYVIGGEGPNIWAHNRVATLEGCEPEVLTVGLDVKPGSCPNPLNVKNKGVLPVAVVGTPEFDITTIDLASVRLAGVAPIRSSFEDVATPADGGECECTTAGPDGHIDLSLKFNTEDIVSAIGEVADGEVLELTLTGGLLDGTAIEGADCIVIIAK